MTNVDKSEFVTKHSGGFINDMRSLYIDVVDGLKGSLNEPEYNPNTSGLHPIEKERVDLALKEYNKPSFLKGSGLFTLGISSLVDIMNQGSNMINYKDKIDSLKGFIKTSSPNLGASNVASGIKNTNALKLISSSFGSDTASQDEYIGSTLMGRPVRATSNQFKRVQIIPKEIFDKVQIPDFRSKMFNAMVFSRDSDTQRRAETKDYIDRLIRQADINAGGEI